MEKFKEKFGKSLVGIVELIIGILLLINPEGFTGGIIMIIGAVLVLTGVVNVIKYFRTPVEIASKAQLLTKGIISALAGAAALIWTNKIVAAFSVITLAYGVILLATGVNKLQFVVDSVRKKEQRWYLGIISAVVSIVLAIVIIVNPFGTTKALWMFTGIALIADAVLDVASVVFVTKAKPKAPEAEEQDG